MTTPLVFDARSPRTAMPFLFVGQTQKEPTVNEAIARIDALLHPTVSGEASAPPANPAAGDCWIVGPSPSGTWADHAGELACYSAGTWLFTAPIMGMRAFDLSQDVYRQWDGDWTTPAFPAEPDGGAIVDIEARSAISALIAALRALGLGL